MERIEEYQMKKRVFFDKYEEMRFISHLDLLRFLERLFQKVNLPIKYSNGFHPRPKMSFGNPISLGTEAFGEIMDIELEEELSVEEVLKRLNSTEILGFHVTRVEDLSEKGNITEEYPYTLYLVKSSEITLDKLGELLAQESILETKIKKGKEVTRELKERIVSWERTENGIQLCTINISPNAYLELLGIRQQEVRIQRLGYQRGNKGEELC